jgi:phage gp29-like protein
MPSMENLGLRWRQMRFNPLRSLTPERLASALDQSDAGWLREAALIYEVIEKRDAMVRSVMTKRRAAVARRDWQVITPDADAPNADAHKATLEYFYNNLTVTDATDLNVRTGFSGLVRQMMDAIIQRYAVHEIVFQPGPGGLTAELRRVPLYFFENRSGKLRFVGPENRADGTELDEDGWMVTVADGVGEALAISYMYKRMGVQDLLAFSEKFSIPGVLGRTSAKKDTPEGNAMRDSVLAYASEWVGLVYGDEGSIKDPIQVIQTPSGGVLPQMTIAEYMDRMIAVLVQGGDLSTISRAGDSAGANPQMEAMESLIEDDCALVSETLQTQLDRLVIRMVHGDESPAAYVVVNPPSNKDLVKDLAVDEGLLRLGVTQDPDDLAERYGREVGQVKAETLKEDVDQAAGNEGMSDPTADLRKALSADMRPLGEALAAALQAGDEAAFQAALKKISAGMPEFLESAAMEELMASEFVKALTAEAAEMAENYNPEQARVPKGSPDGGKWTAGGGGGSTVDDNSPESPEKRDADYIDAVNRGDIHLAQSMVDAEVSKKIPRGEIDVLPTTDEEEIISWLKNKLGDSDDRAIGLRSIYEREVGKTELGQSFYRNESSEILDGLNGVSTYRVSPDFEFGGPDFKTEKQWLKAALKESKSAGDQDFLAIVAGKLEVDEIFADPHEQVISSAQVLAYIPRPQLAVVYDEGGKVVSLSKRFPTK